MCGRFTLTRRELAEVADLLGVEVDAAEQARYRPRYNVAPTDWHWIVRAPGRMEPAVWGIADPIVINARAETAAQKPMFRESFARRRCVVPTDGFFEWTGKEGRRRPLWFRPSGGGLLLLAGLWEPGPDGRPAFTILTTDANSDVAQVHDRMPAVLDRDRAKKWLERPALDLLCPAVAGSLVVQPVSARVNDVKNDDPTCLDPPDPEPAPAQLKLL